MADVSTMTLVKIQLNEGALPGELMVPPAAKGVVVFAHGGGSSRFSPRNREMASRLQENNFATLLFDLLTEEEDLEDRFTRAYRFQIDLLADRLGCATDWVIYQAGLSGLPLGYFGASTGAAAALMAATKHESVKAIVSRGGRPDLADGALEEVTVPTLLIVGSEDKTVLQLNREAMVRLSAPHHLAIVDGASHLFEEPGKMAEVARLAIDWYARYLV